MAIPKVMAKEEAMEAQREFTCSYRVLEKCDGSHNQER